MIIGAGLAGLITAHVFPRHKIFEASPEPIEKHKAVLRFRSDAIGRLTGIDFKPVTVRKEIFFDGKRAEPSIALSTITASAFLILRPSLRGDQIY